MPSGPLNSSLGEDPGFFIGRVTSTYGGGGHPFLFFKISEKLNSQEDVGVGEAGVGGDFINNTKLRQENLCNATPSFCLKIHPETDKT